MPFFLPNFIPLTGTLDGVTSVLEWATKLADGEARTLASSREGDIGVPSMEAEVLRAIGIGCAACGDLDGNNTGDIVESP
jgi:hypothetical protein